MRVEFKASFDRDVNAVTDARLLARIRKVIAALEAAAALRDVPQLKCLHGHTDFYRVRLGDFRLGLHVQGDRVTCVRCLHRREIYRYFP